MAPNSAESKPAYQKDEKALCFHGELLYEAKILDIQRQDVKDKTSPYEYRVHYKGWKNTWDDWVPQDRLRKNTEENRELAINLKKASQEQSSSRTAKPSTATKGRKGQTSDLGSGRGSEERNSSVPARGTKRARENDIEKNVRVTRATKRSGASNQVKEPEATISAEASSSGEINQDVVVPVAAGAPIAPAASVAVSSSEVVPAAAPAIEEQVEEEEPGEQQVVAPATSAGLSSSTDAQTTESSKSEKAPSWMRRLAANLTLNDFLSRYRDVNNDPRNVLVLREVPEARKSYIEYIISQGQGNFSQHQARDLLTPEVLSIPWPPRDEPEYLPREHGPVMAPLTQTLADNLRDVSVNIREDEKKKRVRPPVDGLSNADPYEGKVPPQLRIAGLAQTVYLTEEGKEKLRKKAKEKGQKVTEEDYIVLSIHEDADLPSIPLPQVPIFGVSGDPVKSLKKYEHKHHDRAERERKVAANRIVTGHKAQLLEARGDAGFLDRPHRMDDRTQGTQINGETIPSLNNLYVDKHANTREPMLRETQAPEGMLPPRTIEQAMGNRAANRGLERIQLQQAEEEIAREEAEEAAREKLREEARKAAEAAKKAIFANAFEFVVRAHAEEMVKDATNGTTSDTAQDPAEVPTVQGIIDSISRKMSEEERDMRRAAEALIDLSRSGQPTQTSIQAAAPTKKGRGGRKPPAGKRENKDASDSDKEPADKKAPKPEKEKVEPTRISARNQAKKAAQAEVEAEEGRKQAALASKKQQNSGAPSTSNPKKRKADDTDELPDTPIAKRRGLSTTDTNTRASAITTNPPMITSEQFKARGLATDSADDHLKGFISSTVRDLGYIAPSTTSNDADVNAPTLPAAARPRWRRNAVVEAESSEDTVASPAKRNAKRKAAAVDDGEASEEMPAKKAKLTRTNKINSSQKEDNVAEAAPAKRSRKGKTPSAEDDAEEEEVQEVVAPKTRRRKTPAADVDDDVIEVSVPKTRKRKAPASEDEDDIVEVLSKKVKLTKNNIKPAPLEAVSKKATKASVKKTVASSKVKQETPAPEPAKGTRSQPKRKVKEVEAAPPTPPESTDASVSESESDSDREVPTKKKASSRKASTKGTASKKKGSTNSSYTGPKRPVSCQLCVTKKARCCDEHCIAARDAGVACRYCKKAGTTCKPEHWDLLLDRKGDQVQKEVKQMLKDNK